MYYPASDSYSKSLNAFEAEADGRFPATKAAKIYGFKSAKDLTDTISTSEWHHVGAYANKVSYYDVPAWLEDQTIISLVGFAARLTKKGKATTLKEAVSSIVWKNLWLDTPSHSSATRRRLRLAPFMETLDCSLGSVEAKAFRAPAHLSTENILAAIDKARLEGASVRLARKKKALRKKIANQLSCHVVKRLKCLGRVEFLKAKFGFHGYKRTWKIIKSRGWTLTEENWVAASKL